MQSSWEKCCCLSACVRSAMSFCHPTWPRCRSSTTAPPALRLHSSWQTLCHLPASPALPDPQPKPPAIPVSYMSGLSAQVHAPSLTLDQQLAVIAKLDAALKEPTEREAALELLQSLQSREDLYHTPGAQIETVLAEQNAQQEEPRGRGQESCNADAAADNGNAAPANWYADPYHRHQLRWFDRVWTDWACDGSRVAKDPIRR